MRKLSGIIAITLVSSILTYAQVLPPDTLWTRTFGGNGFDVGHCVQMTDDGGYIMTGSFTFASVNVFLIKTDSSGAPTMQERFFGGLGTDEGMSVQQTSDGGYIITGYTTSFGAGGSDVYLVRTDSRLDTLWTRTYGYDLDDKGFSVQQTSDGGFILAGQTTGAFTGSDVYLLKIDSSGAVVQPRSFGGSCADGGCSVQPTSDGGYIITGYKQASPLDSLDVYLIKTDANLDTVWTRTFGGDGSDEGRSVRQTSDGGYIITGYTSMGITDDSIDVYLIKTDAAGDTAWTRTFGGPGSFEGQSVRQTSDGGYIITGYTSYGGTDSYNAMVMKTDPGGELNWTKYLGGNGNEAGFSVEQTNEGGYIISGFTDSYGAGNSDVWLVRLEKANVVRVSLTPRAAPIIISAAGGVFEFDAAITNNTTVFRTVDIWTQIHKVEAFVVPILSRANVPLPPAFTIERSLGQQVPGLAPAGNYIYWAFAGDYPWVIVDSDSFSFVKLGAEGPGAMGSPEGWKCYGEPFPGDNPCPASAPDDIELFPPRPNPFNAKTVASFEMRDASFLRLAVYDIAGREIAALAEGWYPAGRHQIVWDASNLPSGVYFARLTAGDFQRTRKVLLIK